jgi:hypothetical protein
MSKMMVDIKIGETLRVGDAAIKLIQKSGQLARLEVTANSDTAIQIPNHPARMSVLPNNGVQHHG